MQFIAEMKQLSRQLEKLGYAVFTPIENEVAIEISQLPPAARADRSQFYIDQHISKIKKADAVLIANYSKNGIENYIGANTLMEMAFAYVLDKLIYLLNPIPQQASTLEIEGIKPIILGGYLDGLGKEENN